MVRDTLTCKLICCCFATHHDNNQIDINNENSEKKWKTCCCIKNCNLHFGLSIFFSFLFIIPAIILLLNQDKLQILELIVDVTAFYALIIYNVIVAALVIVFLIVIIYFEEIKF